MKPRPNNCILTSVNSSDWNNSMMTSSIVLQSAVHWVNEHDITGFHCNGKSIRTSEDFHKMNSGELVYGLETEICLLFRCRSWRRNETEYLFMILLILKVFEKCSFNDFLIHSLSGFTFWCQNFTETQYDVYNTRMFVDILNRWRNLKNE